jgi:cell division protein FtsL
MLGLLLIIIVNIAAAISIFTTAGDKIFSDSPKQPKAIFKRRKTYTLTQNGKILTSAIVVTTVIAIAQFFLTQSKERSLQKLQDLRDSNIASKNRIRDSISSAKIENSKQETIEALARYGYKTDSLNDNLVRIVRDSTNRKITIIQGENPVVNFCLSPIGLKFLYSRNDTIGYSVSICSQNAGAIVKWAKVYIVMSENNYSEPQNKLYFVGSNPLLRKNIGLEKGSTGIIQKLFIVSSNLPSPVKTIYVILNGEYTDSHGSNRNKLLTIGMVDVSGNNEGSGIVASPYDEDIFNFLKAKGISF